jgi:hypothetical protein
MQRHLSAAAVRREGQQGSDRNRDRCPLVVAMNRQAKHAVDELPFMAPGSCWIAHVGFLGGLPGGFLLARTSES